MSPCWLTTHAQTPKRVTAVCLCASFACTKLLKKQSRFQKSLLSQCLSYCLAQSPANLRVFNSQNWRKKNWPTRVKRVLMIVSSKTCTGERGTMPSQCVGPIDLGNLRQKLARVFVQRHLVVVTSPSGVMVDVSWLRMMPIRWNMVESCPVAQAVARQPPIAIRNPPIRDPASWKLVLVAAWTHQPMCSNTMVLHGLPWRSLMTRSTVHHLDEIDILTLQFHPLSSWFHLFQSQQKKTEPTSSFIYFNAVIFNDSGEEHHIYAIGDWGALIGTHPGQMVQPLDKIWNTHWHATETTKQQTKSEQTINKKAIQT